MEQDKVLSGSLDRFFRDLGRAMHYIKGAREHRLPLGLIQVIVYGVR